jgi:creatinine amidohydrolase
MTSRLPGTEGSRPVPVTTRRIAEMTSPQFARAVAACDTLLLPLASVEQGGSHCPLGADVITAEAVALLIAEQADCLVAPTIPYGDTLELGSGPGTVDAGTAAFAAYVEAVAGSFMRQGFRNIVFLCTHSLDLRAVDSVCRRLRMQGWGVGAIDWWKAVGEAAKGQTGSAAPFGHGGEVITSVMLALAPETVDLDSAEDESPLPALSFVAAHGPGSAFVAYGNFRDYCRSGAWGAVRGIATAQKGRAWIDGAVGNAARFVLELKAAFPAGPNDGS